LMLLACSSFAQSSYTIRKGDTIGAVAKRLGVSVSALKAANPGLKATRLQIGQKIRVVKGTIAAKSGTAKGSRSGVTRQQARSRTSGYAVRNGDNDWTIARKHGLSVEQLHRLNPGVHWRSLQIGQHLRVAGASRQPSAKPASRVASKPGSYVVRPGDNDWVIAKRLGTTASAIRSLNPGLKWDRLQIGQTLKVPGGRSVSSAIRSKYVIVKASDVSLRRGHSTSTGRVAVLSKGTKAAVLDRESGWYKLRLPSGQVGWTRGEYLAASSKAPASQSAPRVARGAPTPRSPYTRSPRYALVTPRKGATLLDTAFAQLGTRYRWGGSSRGGFDCSGFTTYVFRTHGVSLPRTSRDMSHYGQPVSKGALMPGDLVFFKTNRGTRINHVGIYIGSGKFIHSSSSAGHVKIDYLSQGYYSRRFAGARRVVKLKGSAIAKAPVGAKSAGTKPQAERDAGEAPVESRPAVTPGADEIGR
jgi:cell wall-associated NlpC family hydrolase/LysM repeat protein